MTSFRIPGFVSRNKRADFRWSSSDPNEIHVFTQPSKEKSKSKSNLVELISLKWGSYIQESTKLIQEGHHVFLHLQQKMKDLAESDYRGNKRDKNKKQKEIIKEISKQFRAILSDQVLLLQDYQTQQQEIEFKSKIQIYKIAIVIWHFAEIFILNSSYEEYDEEETSISDSFDIEDESSEVYEDIRNKERKNKKIKKHRIILSLIEWLSLYFSGANNNNNNNSSSSSEDVFSEILQDRQPENNPNYWNLITKFVIQGQIRNAIELLKQHSNFEPIESYSTMDSETQAAQLFSNRGLLSTLVELLEAMPIINSAQFRRKENINISEDMNTDDLPSEEDEESSVYDFEFTRWQNECKSIRDAFSLQSFGSKEMEDQVKKILSILCGEYSLIVDLTDSWFELLLAMLLYSPSIPSTNSRTPSRRSLVPFTPGGSNKEGNTYSQIIELVNQCMEHYPSPTKLDEILIAIVNKDLFDIINYCAIYFSFENWWLVSHLSDILLHHYYSSTSLVRSASGRKEFALLSAIREMMITDYSIGLISGFGSSCGMWETACSYLSYCPTLGKQYMHFIIEKEPIDSNYKAKKLKNTCQFYNLTPTLISSIGKLLAKQKLQKGRISESIYQMSQLYFFHTESQQLNNYLSYILRIYWNTLQIVFHMEGKEELSPVQEEILNTDFEPVVSAVADIEGLKIPDKLIFLQNLHQLYVARKNGQMQVVGTIAIDMLANKIAPFSFWPVLLDILVPILQNTKSSFTSQQLSKLMNCVEELTTLHKKQLPSLNMNQMSNFQGLLTHAFSTAILEGK